MLHIDGVKKSFGNFPVLERIDLTAASGQFVCVVGPSGCGKTTLLYLVAGFIQPTAGSITVDGNVPRGPGVDRVMVFQDYALFPWKTVAGNVAFGLEALGYPVSQVEALVEQYLDLVGLTRFRTWSVHRLSGGMQQRVALARALVVSPKILLMDEPFAALDSQYRRFMRRFLVELWEKTRQTIVYVTHSINEAVYLADRLYVLTARPASVKRVYTVNLPRPRDRVSAKFTQLRQQIEADLAEEFRESFDERARGQLDQLIRASESEAL